MTCRLCLIDVDTENSVPLFNEFDSDDDPQLLKIIAKHLYINITWDDEISTTICSKCCKHLSEFEKFCVFIKEQQIKLSEKVSVVEDQNVELMQEHIKNEPDEDIVTKEIQYISDEDTDTKEIQFQCKPDEDIDTKEEQQECVPDEVIVINEMQLQCEPHEDDIEKQIELQCEPQQAIEKEVDSQLNTLPLVQSSVICSATSSYSKPPSTSLFHQAYRQYIDESSTSFSFDFAVRKKRARHILDATSIKHLVPLQKIYKSYLMGNPLDIHDRVVIAKSVLEASLINAPLRRLIPKDFVGLAENIAEVFPSELVSTYYTPAKRDKTASGKLWSIYQSKRRVLDAKSETNPQSRPYLDARTVKTQKNLMPKWSAERWREYRTRIQIYTKNLKELRKKDNS